MDRVGMLRGLLLATAALFSGLAPVVYAEDPPVQPSQLIFQINESNGSYTSDASPKKAGGQNLAYFNLTYMTDTYGVTLLGSHSDTTYTYNDPSKSDFHLSTLMDSTVSTYYMMPKWRDLNMRLGVDFNLPTGHSSFTDSELISLMTDGVSKDLITMPSFGKGFNIAPNLIIGGPFGNSVLGLGVRYEITGEYNPASEVPDKKYDPGNLLTVFGSMQYNITPRDQLIVDLSTVMSSRDKQGGVEVMKQGAVYNLGIRYIQSSDTLRMTYATTYGWQEKNQTYGAGGMTTEDRNTNNNHYDLTVNGAYIYSPALMLNGTLGYKNFTANGWESTDPLYDAGYEKGLLGVGGTYAISSNKFVTFDIKGFRVWNGKDALEPNAATYGGFNVDIGFVYMWAATPPPAATESAEKMQEVVPAATPDTSPFPAPIPPPEKPVELAVPAPVAKPIETPKAPPGVTAIPGDGKLTIRWNPVEGADSYNLYWSTVPGSTGRNGETKRGITSNVFELSSLQNGVGHYYVVTAVNAGGESLPSVQSFETPLPSAPSAPTGFSISPGDKTVILNWNAVEGADAYRIYRSASAAEEVRKDERQMAGWLSVVYTTRFIDKDVLNGKTYYYTIAGTNTAGEGAFSEIVSAKPHVPPPAPPRHVSAKVRDDGVMLKWKAVTGAGSYNVYRSTVFGRRGDFVGFTTSNSYLDDSPESGLIFYYVIQSKNGSGKSTFSKQVRVMAGPPTTMKPIRTEEMPKGNAPASSAGKKAE